MVDILQFWCDRNDRLHYWKLIAAAWLIAILGAFPTLSITYGGTGLWPFIVLAALPVLAHLYGFLANLKYIRNWDQPGRVGPALVGVSYLLAVLIGLTQMEIVLALTLPISSVIMATLTFGVFFTGFMPLLAFWLVHLLLSPEVDTRGYTIAMILMTASWVIAMFTGYFLGNA